MADILGALAKRFEGLLAPDPARTLVKPMPQRPGPTPAEILHAEAHKWATRTPAAVLEHLRATAVSVHGEVERARDRHAEMNFWLGYERAVRDMLTAMERWSQPNAGNPEPSDLQGGLNE